LALFVLLDNDLDQPNKRPRLDKTEIEGILITRPSQPLRILDRSEAVSELGLVEHQLLFEQTMPLTGSLHQTLVAGDAAAVLRSIYDAFQRWFEAVVHSIEGDSLVMRSVRITVDAHRPQLLVSWAYKVPRLGAAFYSRRWLM